MKLFFFTCLIFSISLLNAFKLKKSSQAADFTSRATSSGGITSPIDHNSTNNNSTLNETMKMSNETSATNQTESKELAQRSTSIGGDPFNQKKA